MKSATVGTSTLKTQVVDISPFGIWVTHQGKEYFLDYSLFPWFRDAPVKKVFEVHAESKDHLRWAELDIDLSLDSLLNPGNYPLVYQS